MGKNLEGRLSELVASEQEKESLVREIKSKQKEIENALAGIKDLDAALAQAGVQTQDARRQCAGLESEKEQIRSEKEQIKIEKDEKIRMLEALTKAIQEKEELLNEKGIVQKNLEAKLEEEKKAHAKAQAHSRRLEATLLTLEKKIEELISPQDSNP